MSEIKIDAEVLKNIQQEFIKLQVLLKKQNDKPARKQEDLEKDVELKKDLEEVAKFIQELKKLPEPHRGNLALQFIQPLILEMLYLNGKPDLQKMFLEAVLKNFDNQYEEDYKLVKKIFFEHSPALKKGQKAPFAALIFAHYIGYDRGSERRDDQVKWDDTYPILEYLFSKYPTWLNLRLKWDSVNQKTEFSETSNFDLPSNENETFLLFQVIGFFDLTLPPNWDLLRILIDKHANMDIKGEIRGIFGQPSTYGTPSEFFEDRLDSFMRGVDISPTIQKLKVDLEAESQFSIRRQQLRETDYGKAPSGILELMDQYEGTSQPSAATQASDAKQIEEQTRAKAEQKAKEDAKAAREALKQSRGEKPEEAPPGVLGLDQEEPDPNKQKGGAGKKRL